MLEGYRCCILVINMSALISFCQYALPNLGIMLVSHHSDSPIASSSQLTWRTGNLHWVSWTLVLAKPTINCFITIRQWFKRYITEMLSLVEHSSRNSQKVSNVIQLRQKFLPLRLTCCGCHCYNTSASSFRCTLLMTHSQMFLYLY